MSGPVLFLDLESIPSQLPWVRDELRAQVKAPATYKKPESIQQWLDENREVETEAAWLKTSFDGGLGQIVCIGWAWDDEPAQSIQVDDLSTGAEAMMLEQVFAAWFLHTSGTHHQRPVIVGHNHLAFDLPMIWQRSIVHNVRPPLWFPRDPKPWGESTFDTMTAWAGAKGRISMDRLCKVLGIPGKGDISGADVWPMVQAGRLDEVVTYCRADVERTRQIHRRLTFAPTAKWGGAT